jgi:xylulokinase
LDVAATALGSNAWTEERVALSLGTTMQTNVTVHEFPQWSSRYPLWIFSHVVPRAYIAVVWHATAGFTLRWFRDTFCELEVQDAQATGQDVYDILTRLAESAPPGSEGLLVLPHLQGTQLPDLQPGFRGVFFGISPSHTKGHFIRAILEGVAYALRENLEIFEKMGITCRELWATGGGTKSTLWNQINADVTGRPQYLLKCNEASSLGAAILAASGSGIYGNILEACTQMVQSAEVIYPNPENFDVYEKGYRLYKDLFQETKTLFISDK